MAGLGACSPARPRVRLGLTLVGPLRQDFPLPLLPAQWHRHLQAVRCEWHGRGRVGLTNDPSEQRLEAQDGPVGLQGLRSTLFGEYSLRCCSFGRGADGPPTRPDRHQSCALPLPDRGRLPDQTFTQISLSQSTSTRSGSTRAGKPTSRTTTRRMSAAPPPHPLATSAPPRLPVGGGRTRPTMTMKTCRICALRRRRSRRSRATRRMTSEPRSGVFDGL